jgi:hypothetical protein
MSGHEGIVPQEGARSERRMQEEKRLDSCVQGRLLETAQGAALVGVNVKDGVELGELNRRTFLVKWRFAAAAAGGRADGASPMPEQSVIDVARLARSWSGCRQANRGPSCALRALAQGNLSAEVHHRGLTGISVCCA